MEDFSSGKKKLEETLNNLLNAIKDDDFQNFELKPYTLMDCYNFITSWGNADKEAEELYKIYNEITEKSMDIFFEKIKDLEGLEFIDSFIKCTKKINSIINLLSKIFSFLDFYFVKFRKIKELNENSMDVYKKRFFDKLQTKLFTILKEIISKEEKNEEVQKKVEAIMKIINYLDYVKPKIIKEKNELIWKETSEEKTENPNTYKKMWEEFKEKN